MSQNVCQWDGFQAIEKVKNVHHTTIITWVKQVGKLLPDFYHPKQLHKWEN